MSDEKRIIEVNGVKLEVDMRYAKRVDTFKVGDAVKILKKTYGESFDSFPGTIVGFEPFENRPAIVVAYLDFKYDSSEIKFEYITKDTKDVEICQAGDWDLPFQKEAVLKAFDRKVIHLRREADEMEAKKKMFLDRFGIWFSPERIEAKS